MTTISRPGVTSSATVPVHRLNGWLAWLSVILLIVGLGAGFLVGQATKRDTVLPSDLAGTTVTQMLDRYAAAVNSGDATKIASFFATNATFTDTTKDGGYVIEGNTKIAEQIASWHPLGFQISDFGTAIHNGNYVAQYHMSSVDAVMAVYQLEDGKILNMWVVRP